MKTSKDNIKIECTICSEMVPKWDLRSHKIWKHSVPASYDPYVDMLRGLGTKARRHIITNKLVPMVGAGETVVRRVAVPFTRTIRGATIVSINGDFYFGFGAESKTALWSEPELRKIILSIEGIEQYNANGYIWVPSWVEDAVKLYGEGFAEMSFNEFLLKTLDNRP